MEQLLIIPLDQESLQTSTKEENHKIQNSARQ